MAKNSFTRTTADGTQTRYTRKGTQGRKPAGLSEPFLVRIRKSDKRRMDEIAAALGAFWNRSDFVREAVRMHIDLIYPELVKQ